VLLSAGDFHENRHYVLLGIGEFHENRRREGRTSLMVINEITFTRVP
jgi:hypothetical protein